MLCSHFHHDDEGCERRLRHPCEIPTHAENRERNGSKLPAQIRYELSEPRPYRKRWRQQTGGNTAQARSERRQCASRRIEPGKVDTVLENRTRLGVTCSIGQSSRHGAEQRYHQPAEAREQRRPPLSQLAQETGKATHSNEGKAAEQPSGEAARKGH